MLWNEYVSPFNLSSTRLNLPSSLDGACPSSSVEYGNRFGYSCLLLRVQREIHLPTRVLESVCCIPYSPLLNLAHLPFLVMITSACLFILGFALSWAPGIWIIIGETFPTKTRAKQGALSTTCNWFVDSPFHKYLQNTDTRPAGSGTSSSHSSPRSSLVPSVSVTASSLQRATSQGRSSSIFSSTNHPTCH
jgi:Sugar (and other) transporter